MSVTRDDILKDMFDEKIEKLKVQALNDMPRYCTDCHKLTIESDDGEFFVCCDGEGIEHDHTLDDCPIYNDLTAEMIEEIIKGNEK